MLSPSCFFAFFSSLSISQSLDQRQPNCQKCIPSMNRKSLERSLLFLVGGLCRGVCGGGVGAAGREVGNRTEKVGEIPWVLSFLLP